MIHRLQKRAARIVTGNFDFINTCGDDLLEVLKWQTLDERVKHFLSTLMHNVFHSL